MCPDPSRAPRLEARETAVSADQRKQAIGHPAIIPPRVVTAVPRLSTDELERFASHDATEIADLVGPLYVMSSHIGPLVPRTRRAVGQALTVKAVPGDNLAIHGALDLAQDGDILIADWRGYAGGCGSGAQALVAPFERGLRGVVIDGGWRDIEELHDFGFPVFASSVSAWSPAKLLPGEINVPVHCGGVVVEPGDLVIADGEGIAVVPRRWIGLVGDNLPTTLSPAERAARVQRRKNRFSSQFEAAGGQTTPWLDAR